MIEHIDFTNIGFLKVNLSENQLKPVKDEINEIANDFSNALEANKFLVGNINKEFALLQCKDYLNYLLTDYIKEYEDKFQSLRRYAANSENRPLKLNNVWVNFQEKYEFNPVHNHSGVFSFVIWIKIPFYIKEELKQAPGNRGKSPLPGHFCFYYTNILGDICQYDLPIDKTWENTMVLFPAALCHSVHPFYTSDDYRISVSGNFVFNL